MKFRTACADLFGLAAHEHADGNARQHILQIVRAFQWDLGERHDLALAVAIAEIRLRAADKGSFFNLFLPAEPEQLRARTVRQSSGGRIVGIEHGEIIRAAGSRRCALWH